jgi:hypothetical protein
MKNGNNAVDNDTEQLLPASTVGTDNLIYPPLYQNSE